MQAVIVGLAKIRIDETTEEELLKTVPFLVRSETESRITPNVETGVVESGLARFYYFASSNRQSWMRFEALAWKYSNVTYPKKTFPKSWIFLVADFLGYRYMGFRAGIFLLNGKVSSIQYGIANTLVFPERLGEVVSLSSFHSLWMPHRSGFHVPSTTDESPEFYVEGDDNHLYTEFSVDASSQSKLDAFQIDLSCFWRLYGCEHARQMAPRLWEDKLTIERSALARLQSDNPCPDRILPGRVRYLSDVSIALLESTGSHPVSTAGGNARAGNELRQDFRQIEVLHGPPWASWQSVQPGATIPFPGDYSRTLPNRGLQWATARGQVLAFYNLLFDSCQLVPATPSALDAVRSAVPASRRLEDEGGRSLQ